MFEEGRNGSYSFQFHAGRVQSSVTSHLHLQNLVVGNVLVENAQQLNGKKRLTKMLSDYKGNLEKLVLWIRHMDTLDFGVGAGMGLGGRVQ